MERHAMIIGIKKEKIEEYKKYHKNPWPEIKECIAKSNIKKFLFIFIIQLFLDILNIMEKILNLICNYGQIIARCRNGGKYIFLC